MAFVGRKKSKGRFQHKRMQPTRVIALTFAAIILLGTGLLMLPIASRSGESCGLRPALFTATSATCVTGLVLGDTWSLWSGFGQAVIISLIEIGGLGFMSAASVIFFLFRRKVGLRQRMVMAQALSLNEMESVVRLQKWVLFGSLSVQALGALILFFRFLPNFGASRSAVWGLFHAISAFCNAGFDLMGVKEPYSSLTYFAENPTINFTIMSLIVIGGIGFLTWEDIRTHKWNVKRYRMQSKVILATTAILIILPTIYFFFFEFQDMMLKNRMLESLFQAITPRTAGFNTADLTQISESGLAIMILLMLIGGSPGSTAGGMKTTTFAVMVSTAISVFRRREHTNFFGRRIEDDTIRNASTILMMYLTFFFAGGLMISSIEGIPLVTCLFETASAIGTVGLTLGITPQLGTVSQMILICLMYLGRVGGLTLIFATLSVDKKVLIKYPKEKMTVG